MDSYASRRPGFALGLLLAGLFSLWAAPASARSCVEPALDSFPVVLHAEVLRKLPGDRMRVRLVAVLRGPETRDSLVVGYRNVMVWAERDPFRAKARWILAFRRTSADYELVLCATAYLPVEDGRVSVDIDGSGYQNLTVEQIGDRLAEG